VAMHVLDSFLSSSGVLWNDLPPACWIQMLVAKAVSPLAPMMLISTDTRVIKHFTSFWRQESKCLTIHDGLIFFYPIYSLSNKTSFLVKEKKREHEGAVTIIFLLSKDKVLFNLGWKNGIRLNALWKNYFA
jgi:hypothetical protein